MQSSTPLHTDDGVRINLPKDFYVVQNRRCLVTGQSSNYVCNSFSTTNSIEIYSLPVTPMVPNQVFTFNVKGVIRNPGTLNKISGPFLLSSITYDNKTRDSCSYTLAEGYYTLSNITDFKITPLDTGVGFYPARYRFELWPFGDIWAFSSFLITMPPTIKIYSEGDFQRRCGSNLVGFTNNLITCKTHDNLIFVN